MTVLVFLIEFLEDCLEYLLDVVLVEMMPILIAAFLMFVLNRIANFKSDRDQNK